MCWASTYGALLLSHGLQPPISRGLTLAALGAHSLRTDGPSANTGRRKTRWSKQSSQHCHTSVGKGLGRLQWVHGVVKGRGGWMAGAELTAASQHGQLLGVSVNKTSFSTCTGIARATGRRQMPQHADAMPINARVHIGNVSSFLYTALGTVLNI